MSKAEGNVNGFMNSIEYPLFSIVLAVALGKVFFEWFKKVPITQPCQSSSSIAMLRFTILAQFVISCMYLWTAAWNTASLCMYLSVASFVLVYNFQIHHLRVVAGAQLFMLFVILGANLFTMSGTAMFDQINDTRACKERFDWHKGAGFLCHSSRLPFLFVFLFPFYQATFVAIAGMAYMTTLTPDMPTLDQLKPQRPASQHQPVANVYGGNTEYTAGHQCAEPSAGQW